MTPEINCHRDGGSTSATKSPSRMSRLVNLVVMSVSFATSRPISWGSVDRPRHHDRSSTTVRVVIFGSIRLYGALLSNRLGRRYDASVREPSRKLGYQCSDVNEVTAGFNRRFPSCHLPPLALRVRKSYHPPKLFGLSISMRSGRQSIRNFSVFVFVNKFRPQRIDVPLCISQHRRPISWVGLDSMISERD